MLTLPGHRFKIDRKKYLPAPKVHGALVEFELLPPSSRVVVPSEPAFLKLVSAALPRARVEGRNSPLDYGSAGGGMLDWRRCVGVTTGATPLVSPLFPPLGSSLPPSGADEKGV